MCLVRIAEFGFSVNAVNFGHFGQGSRVACVRDYVSTRHSSLCDAYNWTAVSRAAFCIPVYSLP